ncbi:MAG: CAP domain-containing protein [Paracoccus sp. (in: a-proteobacteria)]|nr:CAP domain-containing protein [Paracoccus sp. (in: a-proteobacteria)]
MRLIALTFAFLCLIPLAATADSRINVRNDLTVVQAARPGQPHCVATSRDDARQALEATNALRRQHGLRPLRVNAALAAAAAGHACDMAARGLMTHEGRAGGGPAQRARAAGFQPRTTAENIAAGPFTLERVVAEWNRSPGHMGNILLPQIRDFGIGRAVAEDGKTVFWAAVYAAPR